MNEAESFVMCRALDNEELAGVAIVGVVRSRELVHKSMLVVYASAPVTIRIPKRLRFANAGVAVALYVLDEQIYSLEDFLVLQLPSRVFISGARRESEIHVNRLSYGSISSCRCPSPRSIDAIDSRRTRWLASDQNGSGFSEITSNGRRRRMTDWRKNRRMALDMSSPACANNSSASFRRSESTRICSVDVAIAKSFVVQTHYIISHSHLECKG